MKKVGFSCKGSSRTIFTLNSHMSLNILMHQKLFNTMSYKESNEHPTKSCCEKIHEAIFGKSNRSTNKNDVQNRYDYPTVKPNVSSTPFHSVPHEVKISQHSVHFLSNNVENNGDGGGKAFSEDEYNSYINGMKMKMGASSNVGGEPKVSRSEPKVSRDDSFNDTVSSFIGRTKLKLVARPTVSDVGRTLEPYN